MIILSVAGYVAYLLLSYDRIDDMQELTPSANAGVEAAKTGETYTIFTQNLGFGAYTSDYTFFMDGGESSWAASKDSVVDCISQAGEEAVSFDPDFVFFQEVDIGGTRSYHVDERDILTEALPDYSYVFAQNYHSSFLLYPFTQPHGANNSGMMTFSGIKIGSSMRRQLPISTGFSKFVDLDRCYSVTRIPVENGKELLLYNIHSSAYGGSDEIRTAQMNMLLGDMKSEYDAGNYCICGGDFNHDFTGDSAARLNDSGQDISSLGWAQPFPSDLLLDGLSQCLDYDDNELIPTCRNCDVPYGDDCAVVIVDGFIVSDNVTVNSLKNIDLGFAYTDHNPVVMKFELKEADQ